jgi:hypothetical protein
MGLGRGIRVKPFMPNRALDKLFLRIYAKNLKRSYRSDPANACNDAEIQVTTMLLIAILAFFCIVGSIFFPVSFALFLNSRDLKYGVLIALTIAVAYGVHKQFGSYENSPELARKYDTVKNHRWSMIAYWSVMVGFLFVVLVFLRYRHS